VSAKRIRELQDQIAAQKARVLATGRQRGDLHVLRQEVESAQKAYDTVAASAAQSRLQGMTTQANVVFLGSATEPMEPSGPTPLQAVAVALGGGLLLGVAGALLAEFANRRVRSVDDLETVTQVPILGVVPAPKYRVAPLGPAKRPRRPAPIPLAEPGMGSQVYPLPTRAGTDLDQGPPGDLDFSLANRAPPPPMGRMLVESGRLVPEDVQLIREYATRGGLGFGEAGIALGLLGEDDVRQVLATQFGQAGLPPDSGLAPELIAVTHPYSDAVEQLRALRSQLLLRWFEKQGREAALAVVSPGAGEGRSWMAANLAVLFSQLGKRTILIDADLRHPRQHHMFGVPASVGLCAILAGRAGWETVTEVKALPGLSLLPAGALPPNPQELLARPGFARLIAALHSSYEVILVDTPAADSCADAGLIAARAGAVLMLACRDRSSVPRLAALSAELRQFGVTIVGAALNGAPERGRRH
jgi:chain length determinant protein tyrosine kinase EpsG